MVGLHHQPVAFQVRDYVGIQSQINAIRSSAHRPRLRAERKVAHCAYVLPK
jgi:hypothetical protein